MQEVAKLRRSLDDAEGVSRDTKKDWAVLRSQNIALEERNVSGQTVLSLSGCLYLIFVLFDDYSLCFFYIVVYFYLVLHSR